jgi:membrane associated rhomboid family serine protease
MRLPQPRAALILLGVTIAAWLIAEMLGISDWVALRGGFVPGRMTGPTVIGAVPLWLTPLTATLIHAGIIHLGFNMLMLGYCGRFVEYAVGSPGVMILYVIGAYAAALFQYLAGPTVLIPMVGASGAVSALVGAYALLYSQRRGAATGRFGHWVQVVWLAAGWIVVQLLVAYATTVSHISIAVAAHIGGFIAGLLLARPLLLWHYRNA